MEILFSTSNIYPSLVVGAVDGSKMDELFSTKQPVSTPSTPSSAATNHLASIATTMSTAVTGLTSKAAANHADADWDETIDYKDMPPDVRARYDLKNHPVDLITMNNLKLYQNDLTKDKHSVIQKLRTVEYPALGLGNTTKHEGQTYLCMIDGSLFGHLDYQTNKHKSAFLAGAPDMTSRDVSPLYDHGKGWCY